MFLHNLKNVLSFGVIFDIKYHQNLIMVLRFSNSKRKVMCMTVKKHFYKDYFSIKISLKNNGFIISLRVQVHEECRLDVDVY